MFQPMCDYQTLMSILLILHQLYSDSGTSIDVNLYLFYTNCILMVEHLKT